MGFGLLFIGYFFLINITYFEFTDIVGAMIMLMGLYKLSCINRDFRVGAVCCGVFALFSLGELIFGALGIFISGIDASVIMTYISFARYCIIFVLTVSIMRGIYAVAKEVDASDLAASAKRSIPLSLLYVAMALFELPPIGSLLGDAAAYVYFFAIIAVFIYHICNLVTVYRAYMGICMPDDKKGNKKKEKSGFADRIFDKIELGEREYTEYKLNRRHEKQRKGKK